MPWLPQELIETIIDQADDQTTLKSFSITAHRFISPSQRSIFRSLELGQQPGSYEALQARLVASPHLASYIYDLSIDGPNTDAEKSAAAFILRSLPELRSLVFFCSHLGWHDTTNEMVDALEALISQPYLRSFTISNAWDITTSFISRAVASVTFFSISGFNVVVDEASLVPVPEYPSDFHASLKHLVARDEYLGGPRLADVLLSAPASLAHLERLHVNIREPQRLLLAVATTLQHLRIEDADVPEDSPKILPPPSPHLRRLEFSVVILDGSAMPAHLPSVFAKIAEDLPSVEVIVLNCWTSSFPQNPLLPLPTPLPPSAWHFRRLREVQCVVRDPLVGQRLCAALEETIPALQGLTNWHRRTE
ncbi:hypothetical protein C8J57DRAFT_1476496 [Mycena rebaudengoi]|nr:hypothetical protein C8J57DRAFT_1476496 [Mycena rebaudengoi]